jgi:hypothetical protein
MPSLYKLDGNGLWGSISDTGLGHTIQWLCRQSSQNGCTVAGRGQGIWRRRLSP